MRDSIGECVACVSDTVRGGYIGTRILDTVHRFSFCRAGEKCDLYSRLCVRSMRCNVRYIPQYTSQCGERGQVTWCFRRTNVSEISATCRV